ncbi:hypothetical protein HNV11_01985 [Spirosoma taeanense]|uniref:Uncharacterized protein n=1 Tax=Spirosoma taeanense TaxID=2735870 RepID=A0A6M5YDU8_9BACT|nr:hypothetical protein HNV11_01985 [Spirosoma taeanense]
MTFRHAPTAEVLFPDTARHFLPFRVRQITITPTETTGQGLSAISRDSAVYTLISFETDPAQLLRVPIRLINARDCTILMTGIDTVFLRSRLTSPASGSGLPTGLTLASATRLAPLQQQFNYPALGLVLLVLSLTALLLYGLFGRSIRRQWRLYGLRQQHLRFMRDYNRLSRGINADTAADTANQAVITWKAYLEQLENQPYASLTTLEIAERTGDERVTDALREADRMIYGGSFSAQLPESLRVLREVADQTYRRRRQRIANRATHPVASPDAAEPSTLA